MFKAGMFRRVLLSTIAMAALVAPASPPISPRPRERRRPSRSSRASSATTSRWSAADRASRISQDESEQAAKDDWLAKAKAVYPDADLATAKDVKWECVKQGLYSKCFLAAVPCHPKP